MKIKAFALCSTAAAITGCDVDSNNDPNTLGRITLSGTPISGESLTNNSIGAAISVQGSYTDDGGIYESHVSDPNCAHAVAGAKELYYIQSSGAGAGSTWTADN